MFTSVQLFGVYRKIFRHKYLSIYGIMVRDKVPKKDRFIYDNIETSTQLSWSVNCAEVKTVTEWILINRK